MDFLYIPVENTRLLVKDWYALKSWPYNSPHPPDRYYQHFIIHHGPHAYRHGPPIHPHRAQVKVMIFNAVACRAASKGD